MAKSPRVSGAMLRTTVAGLRLPAARWLFAKMMRDELGITALSSIEESVRGKLPYPLRPRQARADHERPSQELGPLAVRAWPRTIAALARAYADGSTTPREVVERAYTGARALAARKPSIGPIHVYDEGTARAAADEATARIRTGTARGPLDGVPIVVKEEVDVRGLATRLGTSWISDAPAETDAECVRRLRAAGAVILGHSPMTEYGLSPLGANPHRAMPRNPHHAGRLAGGSSTGSGVAVATGVSPVAIGADGGGSIRTPAAHCGVFGLKSTMGRISRRGHGLGGTVSVLGPIGASAADLAIGMETIGGEDPEDERGVGQPAIAPGALQAALGRGVRGLRIGVDDFEWADASADVGRAGRAALAALEKEGAILVGIRTRLAKHAASIGYVTIGLEEYADLREAREAHLDELGLDVQINLAALSAFPGGDYLDAQRLRIGLRDETAALLADVDVIALPSVGMTATAVSDKEADGGFLDASVLHAHCRYAFLANLLGLPAGSAPVGKDGDGLPIGLQIVGDAWDEAAVLQVLGHLERSEAARTDRPAVSVDLLGSAA